MGKIWAGEIVSTQPTGARVYAFLRGVRSVCPLGRDFMITWAVFEEDGQHFALAYGGNSVVLPLRNKSAWLSHVN